MGDSSFIDLMIDTDEYLIDDWQSDFPILEDTNTKTGSGSETGFELVPERMRKDNMVSSTYSSSSSSFSSSGTPKLQVLSFGTPDTKTNNPVGTSLNFSNQVSMEQKVGSKIKNGGRREPHLLKEHVLAERKRRQKLNERFIALSALLPGLKKTDKATVLEDAIKHSKQLQERVKKLEEERVGSRQMDQSVILVKMEKVVCSLEIIVIYIQNIFTSSPSLTLKYGKLYNPKYGN